MPFENLKEVLNDEVEKLPEEVKLPTHVDEVDLLKNQLLAEKFKRLQAEYVLVSNESEKTKRELETSNALMSRKYSMDITKDRIDPETKEIIRAK